MDKHHFGNSRAHEVLAEYLTELGEPRLCQRATAMLQQYNLDRKEIVKSDLSCRMKYILLECLKDRYEQNCVNETIMGENEFLRTLLINVLTIGYRVDINNVRSENESRIQTRTY